MLGLVKVVPVIDKHLDEAYSETLHTIPSLQSLPDIIRDSSREDTQNTQNTKRTDDGDFGQNLSANFKLGFSFTAALLSAKKRAIQGSAASMERVGSDYFTRQVSAMGYGQSCSAGSLE